jgi:DNA polymerase-4
MDAFYVSVELRRRPDLRGAPVVVGGTGPRGVVAAASYEARRFGIFSAMPSAVARRRCPHAVFLPGDHEHYAAVSTQVHEVFRSMTPLVEPLALDEAFLDVTGAIRLLGPASAIGTTIRDRIRDELDLVCSVGGATSKFIAKLASKQAKPIVRPDRVDPGLGVLLVPPGSELDFLHPLPVTALWGVGPATMTRLERFAVRTIGDLAHIDRAALIAAVGAAHGRHLHDLAWGRDRRPVEPDRDVKSIGHEETFASDRFDVDDLGRELVRLADGVASRLRRAKLGARTVQLKVRFADFRTITRSTTAVAPVTTTAAIVGIARPMLERLADDIAGGVRLLGVSVSGFAERAEQLSFDLGSDVAATLDTATGDAGRNDAVEVDGQDWVAASETIDAIRERFGSGSIGPASTMGPTGLRPVRPGAQQWGPDHDANRTTDRPT